MSAKIIENFDKPSPAGNEFRSDTFTTPTVLMVLALQHATVGDSVVNEDDATNALEAKVAKLAGKERGLFCVSGTLSNQIAIRAHLHQPPYSVLGDFRCHVFVHEAGGIPTLSQALPISVHPKNDLYMTLEDDILPNYVPDDEDIHCAPTRLICLENTLHGMLYPIEEIKKISEWAHANGIAVHLDGARLWDATVVLGHLIEDYAKYFDLVSLCLSKGLGAPIGSVLVGSEKFIKKANHFKKQNGGGIRQSGILTVMASQALDDNWSKLSTAHAFAKEVGEFLEGQGVKLHHPVQTNFVFIDMAENKMDPLVFEAKAKQHNVKVWPGRLAFHYQNTREGVDNLKRALQDTIDESKKNPYQGPRAKFYSTEKTDLPTN